MAETFRIYTSAAQELAPFIAGVNASDEVREIQASSARVRQQYGISYDPQKRGFVCRDEIPDGEKVPFAVYTGVVFNEKNERKQQELLGERRLERDVLDPADFNAYTTVLSPFVPGDGVLVVVADPDDTAVPRDARAEFLNNSCFSANCCFKLVGPQPVPALVAYTCGRRIGPGEELTIKYGGTFPRLLSECRELVERLRGQGVASYVDECKCSSGRCDRGFVMLGVRPTASAIGALPLDEVHLSGDAQPSGSCVRPTGGWAYRPYQKRKREEP